MERGYADASAREYTVEVRGGRRLSTLETTTSADVGRIQIEPKVDATAASPDRWGRTLVLAVDIHTARRDAQLARPVRVFIGRQDQDPEFRVLGWIHAPRDRSDVEPSGSRVCIAADRLRECGVDHAVDRTAP